MDVKEFFKLNILKSFLAIFLIIVLFEILMLNFTSPYATNFIKTLMLLIISLILGYFIACLIDYFIESRAIKIVIAVLLAIGALILGWFSLVRNVMVCDPVHLPDGDPMICDPVHQP